jgi:hypothetical protein
MYTLLNSSNQAQDNKTLFDQFARIVTTSYVTDAEAVKLLSHFSEALKLHLESNTPAAETQRKSHLGGGEANKNSILRILPHHYIHAQHTLRHMQIRDTKTKLLYTLNFFRAIQKRLALDLREFAGRDIVSSQVDIKPP